MLTPLDIQKKEFRRSFRGYNMEEVDQFLDRLVQDYESLFLENQVLKEKLDASEAAKSRYQEMEKIIKDSVIMAQKNADELQRNAKHEADLILEEARLRAEKIIGEAGEKAAQMLQEAREQARFRIEEAEDRVRSVLEEYRFLEKQVTVFRVKFRSFLEAQMDLLDEQDSEAREIMINTGLGLEEAAAGRDVGTRAEPGPARDHHGSDGRQPGEPERDDEEESAGQAG